MDGASPTAFMWFFAYVWAVWSCKAIASRRYSPWTGDPQVHGVTVLVPVYNEPEAIFLFLHQFDEMYLREFRA